MTTRPGYVWDATASEWVEIGQAAVVAPVAYQTSEPVSPATGDIWIDSDDEVPSVDSTLYYRWTKTMSGGETSLSGTDDNSLALEYTPGYESVFINGVLQVRGSDYVATDGTTVTGLTALTASDVVMVESIVAYSVGDTYTQTQIGSLLDAKSPVSTTGLVLLLDQSFTTTSQVDVTNCFSSNYKNYKVIIYLSAASASSTLSMKFLIGTTPTSSSLWRQALVGLTSGGGASNYNAASVTSALVIQYLSGSYHEVAELEIFNPNATVNTNVFNRYVYGQMDTRVGASQYFDTSQFTGFNLIPASGTITGTIKVYGYK